MGKQELKKGVLSVNLPVDLKQEIEDAAKSDRRSISNFLEILIVEAVESRKKALGRI